MSYIFISYAKEDNEIAERLYKDLKELQAQPWMDQYDLYPGQGWRGAIKNAIRHSSHFIALISKNSVRKRGYAQREIVEAIDYVKEIPPDEIFIIPARLDNTNPIFEQLLNLHMTDLFPSYEEGFENIKRSLSLSGGVDVEDQQAKHEPLRRDTERIRSYRQLFDRPALIMPCIFESALFEVIAAMDDISAAIATGALYSRNGRLLKDICPAGEFETDPFFTTIGEIRNMVINVRQLCLEFEFSLKSTAQKIGVNGEFFHMEFFLYDLVNAGAPHGFVRDCISSMDKIDLERNNVIRKINSLLAYSKSRSLPFIVLSSDQVKRSEELEEDEWGGRQRWEEYYLRYHAFIKKVLEQEDVENIK